MASTTENPSNPLPSDDGDYKSSEDSDFDINAPVDGAEDSDASSAEAGGDENGTDGVRPRKRRRISAEDPDDENGLVDAELDSGDEAMIRRAKERRKKKLRLKQKKKGGTGGKDDDDEDEMDVDDDDEGGEGGFVRTRGMKMRMTEERRPLVKTDGATIDVDALWAQMNPGTTPGASDSDKQTRDQNQDQDSEMTDGHGQGENKASLTGAQSGPGEDTITIKRTYKFAGEMITEEKVVPKDSAEAKVYRESEEASKKKPKGDSESAAVEAGLQLRRPLRRISRFDPNPPDAIKKSWERLARTAAGDEQQAKGPKLNTVQKSKLDWAAYVDKTGIQNDLDVHSRAKEGYLGRMEFLGRTEAKQEEERRNARMKYRT